MTHATEQREDIEVHGAPPVLPGMNDSPRLPTRPLPLDDIITADGIDQSEDIQAAVPSAVNYAMPEADSGFDEFDEPPLRIPSAQLPDPDDELPSVRNVLAAHTSDETDEDDATEHPLVNVEGDKEPDDVNVVASDDDQGPIEAEYPQEPHQPQTANPETVPGHAAHDFGWLEQAHQFFAGLDHAMDDLRAGIDTLTEDKSRLEQLHEQIVADHLNTMEAAEAARDRVHDLQQQLADAQRQAAEADESLIAHDDVLTESQEAVSANAQQLAHKQCELADAETQRELANGKLAELIGVTSER